MRSLNVEDGVEGHIADIGNPAEFIRVDARGMVDVAHQAGLIAHLARPVTRAWAIGQRAIIGNSNESERRGYAIFRSFGRSRFFTADGGIRFSAEKVRRPETRSMRSTTLRAPIMAAY